MASIGCSADKPTKSTHQDPSSNTYIIPASRKYPLEQKFGINRQNQKLTRSMLIALQQHREFHIDNESFRNSSDLNLHQQLMTDRILLGESFLAAHEYATKHGPKPS